MEEHEKLLLANIAWAKEKTHLRKDFFLKDLDNQTPKFLWIGCSDSRVPAEEITGVGPGELFVHRNIANLIVHNDLNMLSVLQYAVDVLKVKHIIVCGHYGCGGVKAAMTQSNLGLINKWLRYIKDVYRLHEAELNTFQSQTDKVNRLVELNIIEQVHHVAQTSIVQMCWKEGARPIVHGWVYDMHNGLLKELIELNSESDLGSIYTYKD